MPLLNHSISTILTLLQFLKHVRHISISKLCTGCLLFLECSSSISTLAPTLISSNLCEVLTYSMKTIMPTCPTSALALPTLLYFFIFSCSASTFPDNVLVILIVHCLSHSLDYKLLEGRNFCCLLMYPKHLEWYLALSRHVINIC